MRLLTTGSILLGLFATPAVSQVPAPLADMVRWVYATNEFGARQRFGPVQWTEGGSAYLTVEASQETGGGQDIMRYQTATGARSVFMAAADLIPAGQREPLDMEDYTVSADGRQVLVFTNSTDWSSWASRSTSWSIPTGATASARVPGPRPTSTRC